MEFRVFVFLVITAVLFTRVPPSVDATVHRTCKPLINPQSKYCTETRYYYELTSTGGSWWSSTTYSRVKKTKSVTVCCPGYGGASCKPKCHDVASTHACNRYEGTINHKDGVVTTCSGGACTAPNTCTSCNTGYYPSSDGYCRACDSISNCNIPICTTSGSSSCAWCDGEVQYGVPGQYAFTSHLDSTQCQRACSWRSSYRCYPGTCDSNMLYSSCVCSEGFTGGDCKTFDHAHKDKLRILNPELVLSTANPIDPVLIIPDPTYPNVKKWTNIVTWATLKIDITTSFDAPAVLNPAPYIDKSNTKIGIDNVKFDVILYRGSRQATYTKTKDCKFGTPCTFNKNGVAMSNIPFESILSGGSFSHGDRITFSVSMTNGGKVYYYNRENSQTESYNIVGMTVTSDLMELGFDLYPPTHCLETNPSCGSDSLTTPDFTTSGTFDVTWEGWTDADSDMQQYNIEVYGMHVKDYATKLLEPKTAIAFDTIVDHTSAGTASITLSDRGVYMVELRAQDWAGNTKSTRRILMFDDSSVVTLVNDPIYVTTAEADTNYAWINSVTTIEVTWKDRFLNSDHVNNYWLNDVRQSDYIARELDDTSTVSARSLAAIHHINGIVSVNITYTKTEGLSSTISDVDKGSIPIRDFNKQKYTITEDLVDGKQLNITVRASDIMGAFAEDTTNIAIDLSPPEVENMWLTKDDILNVSVHNLEELNLVTFEWDTFDIHSGIHSISWRLYDNYTKTEIIHGTAAETPQGSTQSLSECESTYGSYPRGHNCYCTPVSGCFHKHFQVKPLIVTTASGGILSGKETGVHESEYFFEVTVINQARLQTVVNYKITIDTSPPHTGVVLDGTTGQPEVDFQQSNTLSAHWSGFFDKESGIAYYKYAFGTACLQSSAFDQGSVVPLNETYLTSASFTAPTKETYYITVAAYNHAQDHSEAVCSDGVTIDDDVPEISEVVVEGTSTREGLIKDSNDNVWVITSERIIEQIDSPSAACIGNATTVTMDTINSLPSRRLLNGSISTIASSDICNSLEGINSPIFSYITSDAHMIISWNVSATVSGIHDYEVGLSSNGIAADTMAFASTNQHQHVKLIHPNIWNGQEFFILLKAISKSAVEDTKAIGPFIVEAVNPDASAVVVTLGYEEVGGEGYLVASWNASLFSSPSGHLSLTYTFSIGTTAGDHDLLSYQGLSQGASCSISSCTAVAVSQLPWDLHGHQSYYLTVKGTNAAGLFGLATSAAYIHDVELASTGIVFDVKPASTALIQDIEDIDFQTSTDSMTVKWSGFAHPHLSIVYHVCIREGNGTAFQQCEVSSSNDSHTFTSLSLTAFVTYYQDVIAETDVGNVTVSSDGVTIVVENAALTGIVVNDGETCEPLDDAFPNFENASHHSEDKRLVCQNDVEYQSGTNVLRAYWTIPGDKTAYTPDVYYSIDQQLTSTGAWTQLRNYKHVKTSDHIKVTGLFLNSGQKYRVTLKLCAAEYCFTPVSSSGVTVISSPPTTGALDVTYDTTNDVVNVQVTRFFDPDIADAADAKAVIDHYEWAFTDTDHNGKILGKWSTQYITDTPSNPQVAIAILQTKNISLTKCWKVSVRGYTKAGLSSVVSETVRNCSDIEQLVPALVIDAVGEKVMSADSSIDTHEGQQIKLDENKYWEAPDKDYTPYKNIISATWPTLRVIRALNVSTVTDSRATVGTKFQYEHYDWAVLEVQNQDLTVFYEPDDLNLKAPCSHPDAIQCGATSAEFMNAVFSSGELVHGKRYIVCIAANATSIQFEKWTLQLDNISVCSDGITVDITPPIPALVWIGSNMDTAYQITSSDMSINWKPFVDVEEANYAVHESGIAYYEVALGSSKGGVDISDFVNVGITNHHTFHGLQLQSGHSYYAKVRATDFTGQSVVQGSKSVKVDTSPPELTSKAISLESRYITDTNYIEACWEGVFVDGESGMDHYHWAIGSFQGYDDVMSYTVTSSECAQSNVSQPLMLKEGHTYFVSVKGFNRAGQYTLAVSWAFMVDATPPVAGSVYDGVRPGAGLLKDIDYATSSTTVSAHWSDFYESHGTLKGYTVYVGSCAGCDDVLAKQSVGITNDITIDEVSLAEGQEFYVTVTACNAADLCTTATSDGFICDSSPPLPGRVIDGMDGRDIQYQASRITVGAEWYGFVDPQSGISSYIWRVGTTPGGEDVVSPENVHMSQEAFIIDLQAYLGIQLPTDTKLYITVRAYNKIGMYTESTSNGFVVDDSAPVFSTALSQSNIGSAVTLTSVLRSTLKVEWEVEDTESFIDEQYLSISSHLGGDFSLSSVKVEGIIRDYTFSDLDLHDGSRYDVTIVSCNGAKLCTESTVQNILVDSSAPTPGTFAINTDHAAALDRQEGDWMTWGILSVNMAWLGFEDEHTGIDRYMINFGSTFMGDDLNKVPGSPHVITHATSGPSVDEGMVQVQQIYTSSLARTSVLFISIWAINGVGLPSPILHAQFNLVYGGAMFLVRRCAAETCYGHCVCAPHGQLCHSSSVCQDVSTSNPNTEIEVEDVLDLTYPTNVAAPSHSSVSTMLAARWTLKQSRGMAPSWYEWSIGLTSGASPTGIYNTITDRVWHDAGRNLTWVVSLDAGTKLVEGLTYSFFIRVWYDANTYAIFKSPGLLVHSKPPTSTNINGRVVKEVEYGDTKDVDYLDSGTILFVDWTGKFLNNDNSLQKFHLYISTYPGGHDVNILSMDLPPSTTTYDITSLNYVESTTYYCVVQAFNLAGLHTTENSDGFVIDNNPPSIGLVNDGEVLKDIQAISSADFIPAFWHGFVDEVSSVRSYNVCISSRSYKGRCDVHPLTEVGLQQTARLVPTVDLTNGVTLITEVYAFDQAGHMSARASSSGVTIDTTPPIRATDYVYSSNVINNPSFEVGTPGKNINNLDNMVSGDCSVPDSWQVASESCTVSVKDDTVDALPDGFNFIVVKGTVAQEVLNLANLGHYRLTFYTSYIQTDLSVKSAAEISVTVDDSEHVLLLYNKPTITDSSSSDSAFRWQKHTLYFTISQPNVTISIATVGHTSHFALDNVVLEYGAKQSADEVEKEGHVKAHSVFVHDWASIHADWNFVDDESGIVEYRWAVGTVEGGTQLQPFTSVGRRTFAFTSSLSLVHDTKVYVTVLAINGAGLKTLSYSELILVDMTPPIIVRLYDGLDTAADKDFQNDYNIKANWLMQDVESDIKSCSFAIGSQSNPELYKNFTALDSGANDVTVSLSSSVIGSSTVYFTLRCANGAGLTTTGQTDGIKIMTDPPSTNNTILEMLAVSMTQYPVRDGFHADSEQVRFRWSGFREDEGIDSYLVALDGNNVHMDELVDGTTAGSTYADFLNLNLIDGTYSVSVTGINSLQMYSSKLSQGFILYTQPPTLTGTVVISSWNQGSKELTASWTGVFTSLYPMYYEVTIGQTEGGNGDAVQWQETTDTQFAGIINTNGFPAAGVNMRITVTAISYSGFFTSTAKEQFITI